MEHDLTPPDPWAALRAHTAARIALGRSGASLPTAEWLRFGVAHAQARDAVHQALDTDALARGLQQHGFDSLVAESTAPDRATFLQRPDLGRALSGRSRGLLQGLAATPVDVVCVVGDGLSATAAQRHALPLLRDWRPLLEQAGLTLGPVVLARQCRVALGDEIGLALQARLAVVLLGERPGLSSPDSLGAYLTFGPRPGRRDAERNCISNIRPEGLPPAEAARRLAWLCTAALQRGATGIRLKDESEPPPALPAA
ncbi:MAG: ethanolamine ammonia-lyase subunit EutC [Pseudomonadota bacterium]